MTRLHDPVKRESPLRQALCVGGIFAISTVLPDKIEHLAIHLVEINRSGVDGLAEHSLQLVGCFVLLSVLIWLAEGKQVKRHPLLSYPPHTKPMALTHIVGLVAGAALLVAPH
jgi:hypothetical protein